MRATELRIWSPQSVENFQNPYDGLGIDLWLQIQASNIAVTPRNTERWWSEVDGSTRQCLAITQQELPGHAVLEARAAAAESRQPFALYSQVSLRGCHQSLMPSYRLPQKICQSNSLDEFGMIYPQTASLPPAEFNSPPFWTIDEEWSSLYLGVHRVSNPHQKWNISGWKVYATLERPTDALYYLESTTKIFKTP